MSAATDRIDEAPHEGECLACFVTRRVEQTGCDMTLRWARHYRDLVASADARLELRLEAAGGFCDCEIPMNLWSLAPPWAVGECVWPPTLPTCAGVPLGSTQPCLRWVEADAS